MSPRPRSPADATDDHDLGLLHDLHVLRCQHQRRRLLGGLLAGAGSLAVWGCGGAGDGAESASAGGSVSSIASGGSNVSVSSNASESGGSTSGASSCSTIPEETAGPYPGDGSNTSGGTTANALALTGIVRSDIRSSIAGASGTASGIPLTVILDLVNSNASCADLAGYAVYLWHCDAQGRYSLYSSGVTAENYLRGVQPTASDGTATFKTIVPGCYAGRWPHMHFEIFRSIGVASSWTNKLRTSQLALPEDLCRSVYGGSGYGSSLANLNGITLARDGIFGDGVSTQMATISGDASSGYVARLTVGLAA